mmetsp:Transcript_12558/g.39313  ORF Transcript_12558/g.39313 Transcript_12558/m.39313 type:complete len:264 (+) Transcript_12558:1204-1995(+)
MADGTSGNTSVGLTLPKVALTSLAVGFSARNTSSVVWRSAGAARSVLFTSTTSAFSTCSARSCPTVSKPPWCPASCSFRLLASRLSSQSRPNRLASTTATLRLISVMSVAGMPTSTPMSQCCRIFSGSPIPLSSMTIWWKGRDPIRLESSWTEATRSSDAVQQTQPFESSAISMAPPRSYFCISWASMFTAATSFTTTPRRTPSWFSSTCFNRDVLPAPKKPLSSVTGVRVQFPMPSTRSSAPLKSRMVVVGSTSSSSSSCTL